MCRICRILRIITAGKKWHTIWHNSESALLLHQRPFPVIHINITRCQPFAGDAKKVTFFIAPSQMTLIAVIDGSGLLTHMFSLLWLRMSLCSLASCRNAFDTFSRYVSHLEFLLSNRERLVQFSIFAVIFRSSPLTPPVDEKFPCRRCPVPTRFYILFQLQQTSHAVSNPCPAASHPGRGVVVFPSPSTQTVGYCVE